MITKPQSPNLSSRLLAEIHQAAGDPSDPESRRMSVLLHGFSFTGFVVSSIYSIVALTQGNPGLSLVLMVLALMCAGSLLVYRRTHQVAVSTGPIMAAIFALFIYFVISGGAEGAQLVWSFVLPPMAIYALGHRWGVLIAGLYTATAAIIVMLPWGFLEIAYPTELKHRWLVALIAVLAISALTERSRQRTYLLLKEENRVRREAERELIRAKEAAERAHEAKSEFLANMSHELRTPLTSLLGMNYLLKESGLSKEQLKYATSMERSGEHLIAVINDVLDLSKMEAGQLRLEQICFDARELTEEVMASFLSGATAKELELSMQFIGEMPGQLRGDPARLRQVLENLIGNAIKFTDQGSVKIEVQAVAQCDKQTSVRWSVTDTGIGVPEDKQNKIFEVFQQADGSTTRVYGGTGLGLSICQRLVAAMQGTLGIESRQGEGSTFWFQISFAHQKRESSAGDTPSPCQSAERAERPVRVLAVEDDQASCILIQHMAKRLRCELELVTRGQDAVELAAAGHFDIILMDCHMPGLDGFQTTEAIRSQEAAGDRGRTPIVAVTANVTEENRARCLASGMDDFMVKPYSVGDLEQLLLSWTPRRSDGTGRES